MQSDMSVKTIPGSERAISCLALVSDVSEEKRKQVDVVSSNLLLLRQSVYRGGHGDLR